MLFNPSFKTTISLANIAKTMANKSIFIYEERLKIIRNGLLYEKQFLVLSELKTTLMSKVSLQNAFQSLEEFIFSIV